MKNNMHPQNSIFMDENGEKHCLITLLKNMGTGTSGATIELRKSETHIEWKYTNEEEWKQLVSLEELKGETGARGEQGPAAVVQDATTEVKGVVKMATKVDPVGVENAVDAKEVYTQADIQGLVNLANKNKERINMLIEAFREAGMLQR